MKFNKEKKYSKTSFFWIPTFYDKKNDIYFCEPESKEFVWKFYEKEYWDNFSKRKEKNSKIRQYINKLINLFNIWNIMYISDFKLMNKFINLTKKSKILEIWIWQWKNIIHMYKKWYNIWWIDIDSDNIEKINSQLKEKIVKIWNYEDITINEKFDIIYLRHVLEHFYDINLIINKLYNNLNNWGVIYINVPNAENKSILYKSINNHPHIYHFTIKSLDNIFNENWFLTLNIDTYNYYRKNRILEIIKSIFWISNIKKDSNKGAEFIIWIFKKQI